MTGTSMIHPRALRPRTLRPNTMQPCMLYPEVFMSPYVSSLTELGGSKRPFPVPVHFIPKGKRCIFKLLIPDFFLKKR
jgi:hypothetical protein